MSFGSKSLPPPTAEQLRRWDAIKELRWCCNCNITGYVEIHHLLSDGGLRLGHRYSVGLCQPCHSMVKTRAFKADWPNQRLLDHQDQRIGCGLITVPDKRDRAERPASRKRRARDRRTTASPKTFPRNGRV